MRSLAYTQETTDSLQFAACLIPLAAYTGFTIALVFLHKIYFVRIRN